MEWRFRGSVRALHQMEWPTRGRNDYSTAGRRQTQVAQSRLHTRKQLLRPLNRRSHAGMARLERRNGHSTCGSAHFEAWDGYSIR
jgi:hypothetical protein